MSDRLDDALRDLARVDAPADFDRRVRVQLGATNPGPRAWLRLAAVAGALLLVAGLWMAVSVDRENDDRVAGTVEGGALVGETSVTPTRDTTVFRAGEASVRAGGASALAEASADRRSLGGGWSVPPTSDTLSVPDHERALPALAQLGTIGPESLMSLPVTVDAREVTALTAIAPIDVPALVADEGERR